LAGEYVSNGMVRFIGPDAQYSRTLHQGGMIGYVMDGKASTAITAVNNQLKKHCEKLCMTSESSLSPSVKFENDLVRETLHQFSDRFFTIYHIFLPNRETLK
jgi:hypothetical protein